MTQRAGDGDGALDDAEESAHDKATQALPRPNVNSPAVTSARTPASPIETMRIEEIERSRIFAKMTLAISVCGIIIALSTPGDPVARLVVVICSVASAGGALRVIQVMADPTTYHPRMLLVPVIPIVFGGMSGVYYWGTVSPVTGLMVYGIYFFSLSADRAATTMVYTMVSIIHLAFGVLIMTGVTIDRGVVTMTQMPFLNQLAILIIIEFLYFIAFLTARISQRVTLRAVQRLEQAVRQVAQRDAMLAEARAELDRALKIGGPGRFTDHTIGSYKLGVLIGRGGMGEVYEATHVTNGGEAAMKMLHAGALADPTLVERFMREATAASRINNPHVVRVLEVGMTAGQIPFIAMERLRGNDLAHELRSRRRLPLPAAKVVIDELASGLEAARVAGIVHRDLKPNNIFCDEVGTIRRWMILDFGVSKVGGAGTLTQGAIVGTPAYMSPEQARGEDVDHRADVYSVAAILYRTVTGHPAFSGRDVPTTLYEVCFKMPTRPSKLNTVPEDVERVLAVGLAKEAEARFQTAAELAQWFSAAIESRLTPEQRRRADELLGRTPWGVRIG